MKKNFAPKLDQCLSRFIWDFRNSDILFSTEASWSRVEKGRLHKPLRTRVISGGGLVKICQSRDWKPCLIVWWPLPRWRVGREFRWGIRLVSLLIVYFLSDIRFHIESTDGPEEEDQEDGMFICLTCILWMPDIAFEQRIACHGISTSTVTHCPISWFHRGVRDGSGRDFTALLCICWRTSESHHQDGEIYAQRHYC